MTIRKRANRKVISIIVILVLVVIGYQFAFNSSSAGTSSAKVKIAPPVASVDVNQEFSFPLLDSEGNEVSSVKFLIEKAELRDELLVKGKRATSIKGRTFLVLNLKITNNFNRAIEVDSRDYVRLSVNGDESLWMAADIHNDPVGVQPISTKITRIGFPINDTDKDLVLRIGEIKGEKEIVNLDLKYK